MKLTATIVGQREAIERIRVAPGAINREVEDAIRRAGLMVLRRDKEKLSDDVLHVRSGRLRANQNVRYEHGENVYSAFVGFNVWYGRLHELGWSGTVTRMQTMAWGRPMRDPRQVTYQMTIPKRAFLVPALQELRGEILALFDEAAKRGVGG